MYTSHPPQPNLKELYRKIIDEFAKRLLQKYNQKQQGFDSEMVDQMKTLIIEKIKKPDLLFPKVLQIKHGVTSNQLVIDKVVTNNSQIKKQQFEGHRGEQEVDYAVAFDNRENQVKKQQLDQNGLIKHEPNQDLEDQKQEEDQKQKKQKVAKIKRDLTIHIVGTYQPRSKKHVAKDQSTSVTLQNVFIKVKNISEQFFAPKLICQFRKD